MQISNRNDSTEQSLSAADVTVAVLNYNGINLLSDCIGSIIRLSSPPGEIILVDDGSSDGSLQWLRDHYPALRILEMGVNTKRLNRVRNCALHNARKDLVLLVDNDVRLEHDCLDRLLHAFRTLPTASVCIPRALYDHDPSLIYQDGQILHYVATTFAINRNAPARNANKSPRISIGWGVQLIDRRKAKDVGFFHEAYAMGWGDDGEFNHKMNIADYRCYHVPDAVVFHKRVRGAKRYYGTVYNRGRFILETYQWRTLLLCMPALMVYEIAVFGFLLTKHSAYDYFRAVKDLLSHIPDILTTRKRVQALRRVKDAQLMTSGTIFIWPEYVNSRVLGIGFRILNSFLNGYWRLVRHFL